MICLFTIKLEFRMATEVAGQTYPMVPRSSSAADERNSGSVLKKALHPPATYLQKPF